LTFLFTIGIGLKFGELDYLAFEKDGQAQVTLVQEGEITENLTVPIIAVTFGNFFESGRTLTDDFNSMTLPDPAECKHCSKN
jgi:hypothetical protein